VFGCRLAMPAKTALMAWAAVGWDFDVGFCMDGNG